jgi:hypothetical protein
MADLIALAERWKDEIWQRGNLQYAEQSCADEYTDFSLPDNPEGDILALQDAVAELRAGFSDLQVKVMDSFQDEDSAILRTFFQGTHSAEYNGFQPTNQHLEWESIEILHFEDELILERWAQSDLWQVLEETDSDFFALQANQERAELIAQLADVPKQLRQAIRTRGMHAAANGEWSTGAALGHLWRCEVDVWQYRLAQMQREENPFWEYWDPAQYAWEAEFGATDILSLLDAFEFRRSQTCKYLRALTDEGWARRGEHRVFGKVDVAGLMREALKHDREHLATLSGAQV